MSCLSCCLLLYSQRASVDPNHLGPDSALLKSEPLMANPESDTLILRSEEVELNGMGVHVISIPWTPKSETKKKDSVVSLLSILCCVSFSLPEFFAYCRLRIRK